MVCVTCAPADFDGGAGGKSRGLRRVMSVSYAFVDSEKPVYEPLLIAN